MLSAHAHACLTYGSAPTSRPDENYDGSRCVKVNAYAEDALCFFDGVLVQCFDESCSGLSVEFKPGRK